MVPRILRCTCGCEDFIAARATVILRNLPCRVSPDGPIYDDTEAESSTGWDWGEENLIKCRDCKKRWMIGFDDKANIILEEEDKNDE